MELIDTSITRESLKKSKDSILELMGNPYCDYQMFLSLLERLENTEKMILELEEKQIDAV